MAAKSTGSTSNQYMLAVNLEHGRAPAGYGWGRSQSSFDSSDIHVMPARLPERVGYRIGMSFFDAFSSLLQPGVWY